jgi:hypothetical protein
MVKATTRGRSQRGTTAASTCYSLLVGDMVACDSENLELRLKQSSSYAPSRALTAGFAALYAGALASIARDQLSTALLQMNNASTNEKEPS